MINYFPETKMVNVVKVGMIAHYLALPTLVQPIFLL